MIKFDDIWIGDHYCYKYFKENLRKLQHCWQLSKKFITYHIVYNPDITHPLPNTQNGIIVGNFIY